ncbi:histone-like nucleoid-structuring protein Lsr2 [Actinorugispora endophytica]|uniref:Lsr2 protein n=1 Tax=Actinorugispora endophytica TaxID=1605990 RepID=A0A4R6UWB8_9ACTN|nr:Lsr2 family protein [Actinorugispora endophytica]TDQ50279.1 Lsr2 protein [Actinorugispora endophytica]
MAQKVQVLLVDDIDGGEAEETVVFGLDGSLYEIDLSGPNATQLRAALAPFTEVARKVPAKAGKGIRQRGVPSRERSAEIRAWARAQGKEVNERGRIPQSILDEYNAAQG